MWHERVYLNVPYVQKEEAKELGARWDPEVKKWYYEGDIVNIIKFAKWLFPDDPNCEEVQIVFNTIYIVESTRKCYRCQKATKVIGLGVGPHLQVWRDTVDGKWIYEMSDVSNMEEQQEIQSHDNISLAWVDDERKIPPLILKYLKENYNVGMGRSKIAGRNFANHCQHCGTIQGNNYLFAESESPLSVFEEGEKLKKKVEKMRIYGIEIETPIVVDWDIGYCSQDWAYLEYCNQYKEIDLIGDPDDFVSYKELYNL